MIGEGKPENQNHGIIYIRGEVAGHWHEPSNPFEIWSHHNSIESFGPIVIVYFSNILLDNYLEEALKMRNLLEESKKDHGVLLHTILGVREHIFIERFVH